MNANKIIGIVLILAGAFAIYSGINKVSANTNEVKILGLEIEASNEEGKTEGYLWIGGGVLLLLGGFFVVGKKK